MACVRDRRTAANPRTWFGHRRVDGFGRRGTRDGCLARPRGGSASRRWLGPRRRGASASSPREPRLQFSFGTCTHRGNHGTRPRVHGIAERGVPFLRRGTRRTPLLAHRLCPSGMGCSVGTRARRDRVRRSRTLSARTHRRRPSVVQRYRSGDRTQLQTRTVPARRRRGSRAPCGFRRGVGRRSRERSVDRSACTQFGGVGAPPSPSSPRRRASRTRRRLGVAGRIRRRSSRGRRCRGDVASTSRSSSKPSNAFGGRTSRGRSYPWYRLGGTVARLRPARPVVACRGTHRRGWCLDRSGGASSSFPRPQHGERRDGDGHTSRRCRG